MSSTAILPSSTSDPLRDLLDELLGLRQRILSGTEQEMSDLALDQTTSESISSILNLLNYIVMRREDLRPLQACLTSAGLSSRGRGEPDVLSNIDRVIDILSRSVLHRPHWNCTMQAVCP